MTPAAQSIQDRPFGEAYRQALTGFVLDHAGESALEQAYALGRRAVDERRSLLDMAALHQETLLHTVLELPLDGSRNEHLARGETFFAEVMAPFEMMQRGYRDTIQALQQVNEELERRVEERTQALSDSERKNARLTRLYAILSGINSAIVRLHDRKVLFDEACRIAIERGGFAVAWIGEPQADGSVLPSVWCSRRKDGRDRDRGTIDDLSLKLQEPLSRVLRQGNLVIEEVETMAFGFRAFALLPLHLNGDVVGVFALCLADGAAFCSEETRLFDEMAGDLSFALQYIQKEEEVTYLAYYDTLTDLPNTALLMERLARQIQIATRNRTLIAVLLLDLTRFSGINETYGRHVGDALLKAVGSRLTAAVDPTDTVARAGADQFAVMLTNLSDVGQVAHKLESALLASFERPFQIGDQEVHLSAQLGGACYPIDAKRAEVLYQNAETALRRAMQDNESYLLYDHSMNQRVVHTVSLEAKLRKALDQDWYRLHYQPKVDADSARIVGLEALIRCSDPDNGLIPPGQFVPLLEESDMIVTVGNWVMQRVMRDMRTWRQQGIAPPRVAVNVSPLQLQRADFVPSLEAMIQSMDGDKLDLDIEITESAVMKEVETNIAKLSAVREMGFHIAIDDFGTGYSSLNYLSKLPVHMLKIDQSFIAAMTDSPNNLAIVSSIIDLAHSFKLEVIAEGVEHEEQAKLLRLLRCDQIQGNLFGAAMSLEQITPLLREPK